MVCLGTTGAMRTALTIAFEVLLGLSLLHLQLKAEAKAGIYRLDCNNQRKPKSEGSGHARTTCNMEKRTYPMDGD
jgi:hypothetical protein